MWLIIHSDVHCNNINDKLRGLAAEFVILPIRIWVAWYHLLKIDHSAIQSCIYAYGLFLTQVT